MYIERAWERTLVPQKGDLGFKEPEIREKGGKRKKIKVRTRSSRIVDLVLSVPSSLPMVFLVHSYARTVRMPRLGGGFDGG